MPYPIADLMRCPNTVLQNLPMGFTTSKPTNQVVQAKGSSVTAEYEVPVGGMVSAWSRKEGVRGHSVP